MDATTANVIGLGILALVAIAFVAKFPGKVKIGIESILGKFKAEGENPPPPTSVASGVKIKDAEAGGSVHAHSSGAGGVDLEKVKAKGGIDATHTPGAAPPKA